jgi:TIR domain-containing protein
LGSRYFVSYSRRSSEDSALADLLRAGLEDSGHEVFIDKGIRLGTDWVQEIAARIAWCDYLVVLLSRESVHSEMVLGEVRMAHRRRRRDGRPHILPIRVRYDGDLDYELDSYLARVQYVRWTAAADSAAILKEILDAAAAGPAARPVEVPTAPGRSRPRPTIVAPAPVWAFRLAARSGKTTRSTSAAGWTIKARIWPGSLATPCASEPPARWASRVF